MSCTFWNMRRKKAALKKQENVEPVVEEVERVEPIAKRGGGKNGK